MEKNKIQNWIMNDSCELWDAIAEREGLLSELEFDYLTLYVDELTKVMNWCKTIREADQYKKMLKE